MQEKKYWKYKIGAVDEMSSVMIHNIGTSYMYL